MDNAILKKRLNTYKTSKGTLSKVGEDVVMEVLRAWENWPGSAADLYRDLGLSKMQLVILIKKAKRLVSSGAVKEGEFKEVTLSAIGSQTNGPCQSIELNWDTGNVIRFPQVEQLIYFLKKTA
jgi:hypothetical protein